MLLDWKSFNNFNLDIINIDYIILLLLLLLLLFYIERTIVILIFFISFPTLNFKGQIY